MYEGDQFEPDTIEKNEAEQSPGPKVNDALDLGEDYEMDDEEGIEVNDGEQDTRVQNKN